jgi:hypothetical protein
LSSIAGSRVPIKCSRSVTRYFVPHGLSHGLYISRGDCGVAEGLLEYGVGCGQVLVDLGTSAEKGNINVIGSSIMCGGVSGCQARERAERRRG